MLRQQRFSGAIRAEANAAVLMPRFASAIIHVPRVYDDRPRAAASCLRGNMKGTKQRAANRRRCYRTR